MRRSSISVLTLCVSSDLMSLALSVRALLARFRVNGSSGRLMPSALGITEKGTKRASKRRPGNRIAGSNLPLRLRKGSRRISRFDGGNVVSSHGQKDLPALLMFFPLFILLSVLEEEAEAVSALVLPFACCLETGA